MPDLAIKVSVIVCSHNQRDDFLKRVFGALEAQTLPPPQWELTVVDNSSEVPVSARHDVAWHPNGRIVVEKRLGAMYARIRGIKETSASLIVFVDDDNVLNPDFLEKAEVIGRQWPMLGCWGGNVDPECEIELAGELREFKYLTGELKLEADRWCNFRDSYRATPAGGGLCIRRVVCELYLQRIAHDPFRAGLDRAGKGLLNGADWDLAITSTDLGLGTALFKALGLKHLIKKEKLQLRYLLDLTYGTAYAMTWVKHFRGTLKIPYRELRLAHWLSSLRFNRTRRMFVAAHRRGEEQAFKEIKRARKQARLAAQPQ